MTRPREMVPAHLRHVLAKVAAAGITQEFYLAGGTGLALVLNHRHSVDLDFFSRTNRVDEADRRLLAARLRTIAAWTQLSAKDGTLHGRLGRVRVSFFWYPQRLLKPLIRQGRVRIASLEDIGAMKLAAVIGRGSRKDFIDLYTICQHLPLATLLTLGQHKFRDVHDLSVQALKALSFFEDAERDPPVITPQPLDWTRVKAFFLHEVRRLLPSYLRGT